MPDLGAYAVEVALAYGASILALLVLVGWSVQSARRTKDQLDAAEARKDA